MPFNETKYERLFDEEDDRPPQEQVIVDTENSKWNHISNLDDFFTRVYQYHQQNGFWCMFVNDLFQILQFGFVVFMVIFLSSCIRYEILDTHNHNISISDVIQCRNEIHGFIALLVIIALVYWIWRVLKFIYNTIRYREIRKFYQEVLSIPDGDLYNLDWSEVQKKLIESQKSVLLCLHKECLSELDISNRILRMENYKVAMINKHILPHEFMFPFLGRRIFLTKGLMVNLELILFSGPWAPFKNCWQLDERYKRRDLRKALAQKLEKVISYMALVNLLLMPFIFIWQLIFQLIHYAELVKREPGMLGVRIWSLYSRLFLRHYNEMNHEFDSRLKRAYIPANKYLDLFTSPMLLIISKNVAFFAGALLLVLVSLTLINEELLFADHVPLTITLLGITVSMCKALFPDENQVYCPDVLMKEVLQHTHYQPDSWIESAHMPHVRDQFSQMFVFKGIYLVEELLSPVITPFLLYYNIRHKSLDFVDFLRNYTVNITGVGDVCSFSQMDIKRHGNPDWMSFGLTAASQSDKAEHGKTELSLINFTIRNPAWKPRESEANYISTIKSLAKQDSEGGAGVAGASIPATMLASMGVPSFNPPPSDDSTLTKFLPSHQLNSDTSQPQGMDLGTFSDQQPQSSLHESRRKYIFDEKFSQLAQNYRESCQPITMTGSVQQPMGAPHEVMTSSLQPMASLGQDPGRNIMSMSTIDASLFVSASPNLNHSMLAASTSLSQGDVEDPTLSVSWTNVRREYRSMVRSSDANNSSLYLHSLHQRLKSDAESPESMMTRSLSVRARGLSPDTPRDEQTEGAAMSRSYPVSSEQVNVPRDFDVKFED